MEVVIEYSKSGYGLPWNDSSYHLSLNSVRALLKFLRRTQTGYFRVLNLPKTIAVILYSNIAY